MRRKKIYFLFILFLISCFLLSFFVRDSLLRDDYYEAINKKLLSDIKLEENAYTWSTFTEVQEKADKKMHQVFTNVLGDNYTDLSRQVSVVYENAMNVSQRNQEGLGFLNIYLKELQAVTNISEMIYLIAKIEKELGISILTNIMIDQDYQDTNNYLVYFYPVMFPFGVSGDYFIDDDYMTYFAYIKRAMIQLLEVFGYSREEAREVVSILITFYQDVAISSKSLEELSDVDGLYYRSDFSKLQSIYSNVDMGRYLKYHGLGNLEVYSLVDQEQYQKLNTYLNSSYLDLWKSHLLVMILSHYANYMTEDYEKVVLVLNDALLGVESKGKSREELSEDLVINLFSREIDYVYEKHVLSKEKREYFYDLFDEVKNTYREMLLSNDWLSKKTIEIAIEKLEEIDIYVGLDGVSKDISYLNEFSFQSFDQGGSLLLNVKEIVRLRKELELKKLENETVERKVGESVVNAYYSPMNNAIYIPSATSYLVEMNDDYYVNLGRIGMIIAHEITHAFDDNGSKFDKNGNYFNWWLEEDKKSFDKLKKEVSIYYSKYEVLPGIFINGDFTVNENIADLGAVRCISLIAEKNNATEKEVKKMYSAFAKLWASKSNENYQRLLLLQDSHAPSKYRVNAVLSSTQLYYDVYNVSFFDNMYISSNKRVQVW